MMAGASLNVRPMQDGDGDVLGDIYFRAVREGAAQKYTADQCAAWAKAPPTGADWIARLRRADCVVADQDGVPLGFMSAREGHVDMAFIAPEATGQGIATLLYAVLEGRARASGETAMRTEASLVAEPFFARQGFSVITRQEVVRNGVTLHNCIMEKQL